MIGIVILNYLAYKDTIECIDSIECQTYTDYQIVIVDNCSPNESYKILKQKYEQSEKISIIQTDKNIGFAKGNNIGIQKLAKKNCFRVLVINGDTILEQKNYLEILVSLELTKDIAMLGTSIISRDKINQNPAQVKFNKIIDLVKEKKRINILKKISYTPAFIFQLMKVVNRSLSNSNEKQNLAINGNLHILDPNLEMLHGAAIMFTETYLKEYIGFYPDTFLYYEEEFLALICRKLKLKQAYLPSLIIYHKEDASSNLESKGDNRKALRKKIEIVQSNIGLMSEVLMMSTENLKKKIYKKNEE